MITVGLDFGTHQTKICIEKKDNAELQYDFFKFEDNTGEAKYTLPSIISIDKNGYMRYGYLPESSTNKMQLLKNRIKSYLWKSDNANNKIVKYFKQSTFSNSNNSKEQLEIYYSIWYISFILFDLEKKYGTEFAIQMGVPADGENLNRQKQLVVRILLSAYRLVEDVFKNDKDAFLNTPIAELKEKTELAEYDEDKKDEYNILVFPEAYACLMPLIKSEKIAHGMSLMIDIGGGTTDISFFTIGTDNKPQVYGLYSIDKGLNYLTDVMNTNNKNNSIQNILKKDKIDKFQKEIKTVCSNIISRLEQEFNDQSKLPIDRLTAALKNRPIIYTGGGSTFDCLRMSYLEFKDIIHISTKEWRTECVADIDFIAKSNLCPILSTSYGLSISMADDNIRCEPFKDIFKGLRQIDNNQDEETNNDFNYTDDWSAWK